MKNRALWDYRSTYLYGSRKGAPAQSRAIEFLWEKFSAFFQCDDLFKEISSFHKQRFGFCDSSLFPYTTMTFCDTLHMLLSDQQTCGHDLKVSGKKTS